MKTTKRCSNGHHTLIFNINERVPSNYISTNKTIVDWSIQLSADASWSFSTIGSTITAHINGTQVYSQYAQRSCNGGQTVTWASGSLEIQHDANGSKTVSFDCSYSQSSSASYTPGNASLSGSLKLTNIPRYATVSQSMTSKTETSISMKWVSDATVDYIYYSTNNGSNWTGLNVTDGTSGTYTISGLKANTNYKVKTRVRRKDSQLTTDSSALSITTYQYPYISSISTKDLTIGGSQKVVLYNPLKRNATVYMKQNNTSGKELYKGSTTGTELSFTPTASTLYSSIPNSPNGSAVYYCVYSSQTVSTISGTYKIASSAIPTFKNFSFEDVNSKTVALTGNNQDCIIGFSNIKATISASDKAVANNSATMKKYRLTIGSSTTEANYSSSSDVSLQLNSVSSGTYSVYAIDSRTQSKLVQKVARNIIPYVKPFINSNSTVARKEGVSEEVILSYSGSIWSGNFGTKTNSILSASYRYRISTSSTWTNGVTDIKPTLASGGKFSFSGAIRGDTNEGFNIENAYIVEITIKDELSSYIYSVTLTGGKPHIAYHKKGISFMGAYNETNAGKVQIDGQNIFNIMFPVGAVYITATNTNPQTFLGGTWVAFGQGRTLVGVNTSESEFNSVLKTGGEKTHKMTVSELPSHDHGSKTLKGTVAGIYLGDFRSETSGIASFRQKSLARYSKEDDAINAWGYLDIDATHTHSSVGSNNAHNNLQPYITVYFWRRTK